MTIPFDVYAMTPGRGDLATLTAGIARWHQLGLRGVFFSDHLFAPPLADPPQAAQPASAPFILAATVAALSDHLVVGTMVANVGFEHPALVLRHFNQLAVLHGGTA